MLKSTTVFFLLVSAAICVFGCSVAFGQETISSPLGFSMEKPKGWIVTNDEEMRESLKNIDLSDEALDKILKSRNNSILVMALQKYSTDAKEGPIPTIQVRMRPDPIPAFDDFMAAFLRSVDPSKMPFADYKILGKEKISVSSYQTVRVDSTYTLNSEPIRVRTYAIPVGKQYFQVTFVDMPPGEDCSKIFDGLAQSIKIARNTPKKLKLCTN